jgi:hypothetical protein
MELNIIWEGVTVLIGFEFGSGMKVDGQWMKKSAG